MLTHSINFFASCFALTLAAALVSAAPDIADATAACVDVQNSRNNRDLYEDSSDCHNYIQCFFINATFAVGYRRYCPAGTFWRQQVLSCLPEGSVPCQDQCLNDDVAGKGCYAGLGCRQYFVCANTASHGMCCPAGTKFDNATCLCEESATCADSCSQTAPAIQTTILPASQYNATVCIDSFGAYVSAVAGVNNAYALISADGQATDPLYCPVGVSFNINTCRCDIENGATVPPTQTDKKAVLYLNYNENTNDLSRSGFATELVNGAFRDASISDHSLNGGSLGLPNADSHQSIAGFKSYDFGASFSWSAFFRCSGTNLSCTSSGNVVSNRNGNDYTFDFGVQANNQFVARLNFWQTASTITLQGQFTPDAANRGWSHFAVTYGNNEARLYLNGVLAASQNGGNHLAISHNPAYIGSNFVGQIDGVLFVPFVLDAATIADYNKRGSAAVSNFLPTAENQTSPAINYQPAASPRSQDLVLYMNYNNGTGDLSSYKHATKLFNGAFHDKSISDHSTTGGSLGLPKNESYQSISGLEDYSYSYSFTWSAFFRCSENTWGGWMCPKPGKIMSNDGTFAFTVEPSHEFVAELAFDFVEPFTLRGKYIADPLNRGWSHFAVTYAWDSGLVSLYLDGKLHAIKRVSEEAYLSPGSMAPRIGTNFVGNIDGVLFIASALDAATIADYNKRGSAAIAHLL